MKGKVHSLQSMLYLDSFIPLLLGCISHFLVFFLHSSHHPPVGGLQGKKNKTFEESVHWYGRGRERKALPLCGHTCSASGMDDKWRSFASSHKMDAPPVRNQLKGQLHAISGAELHKLYWDCYGY